MAKWGHSTPASMTWYLNGKVVLLPSPHIEADETRGVLGAPLTFTKQGLKGGLAQNTASRGVALT